MKNRKGQFKNPNTLYIILVIAAILGVIIFISLKQDKETTTTTNTSTPAGFNPNPTTTTTTSGGGLSITATNSTGSSGTLNPNLVSGAKTFLGAIITGTTPVNCVDGTAGNTFCIGKCTVGDTYCQGNIGCFNTKCTYLNQQLLSFKASAKNEGSAGSAGLKIWLDSVSPTGAFTTAFNSQLSETKGKTVQPGETTTTWDSLPVDISTYATGTETKFKVTMKARNLVTGAELPSAFKEYGIIIGPDPTGSFSVQISQLSGI